MEQPPPMPKWYLAIRVLQIVFGVFILAILAFLIARAGEGGLIYPAEVWSLVVCIATFIVVTYNLVAERAARGAYNRWAVLALDILMVVFWLSAMGDLAATRAAFNIDVTYYYRKRDLILWATESYLDLLAASAGLAAIEVILFIVSLALIGTRVHQTRAVNATTPMKMEAGAGQPQYQQQQQQQQFQPQQQQYQQQPAPQQQQDQFVQQPVYQQAPPGQQNMYPPQQQQQQQQVQQPYQTTGSPAPQQQVSPVQQQQQAYQHPPPQQPQQNGFPPQPFQQPYQNTGSPVPQQQQQQFAPAPAGHYPPAEYVGPTQ